MSKFVKRLGLVIEILVLVVACLVCSAVLAQVAFAFTAMLAVIFTPYDPMRYVEDGVWWLSWLIGYVELAAIIYLFKMHGKTLGNRHVMKEVGSSAPRGWEMHKDRFISGVIHVTTPDGRRYSMCAADTKHAGGFYAFVKAMIDSEDDDPPTQELKSYEEVKPLLGVCVLDGSSDRVGVLSPGIMKADYIYQAQDCNDPTIWYDQTREAYDALQETEAVTRIVIEIIQI